MIEIAMRRSGTRLMPVDEHSAEDLIRVPADRDVLVKIVSQRNMKLLRFLWALAGKVADACDWLHDKDDAMDELKIRARHVKYLVNPTTGEVRIVPKSLSKIDGAALSRLANRMVYVVCRDIVPGLDETALRAEIVSMIAGPEDSNSLRGPPAKAADTPSTDSAESVGGNNSNSASGPSADEEQASGDQAAAGLLSTLPEGWAVLYAAALRRAQNKISLPKLAKQFWAQYGSWDNHKNGPDAATAVAIYDAFTVNIGRPELLESALREIV